MTQFGVAPAFGAKPAAASCTGRRRRRSLGTPHLALPWLARARGWHTGCSTPTRRNALLGARTGNPSPRPSRGAGPGASAFARGRRGGGGRGARESRSALGLLRSAPKTPPRCALRLRLTGWTWGRAAHGSVGRRLRLDRLGGGEEMARVRRRSASKTRRAAGVDRSGDGASAEKLGVEDSPSRGGRAGWVRGGDAPVRGGGRCGRCRRGRRSRWRRAGRRARGSRGRRAARGGGSGRRGGRGPARWPGTRRRLRRG